MSTMFLRSLLLPLICVLALATWSHGLSRGQQRPSSLDAASNTLQYHGGPLLTKPNGINVYLIWYGGFSLKDRNSITDFFASFASPGRRQGPSVSTWWRTISTYKDKTGKPVSDAVRLVKQVGDVYSSGKTLKRAQLANFVKSKVESKIFPLDPNGIYLVLTAKDVTVERFCMGSCGFHDSILVGGSTRVVFAHVGDPTVQCPGLCALLVDKMSKASYNAYGANGRKFLLPATWDLIRLNCKVIT